ncbi:hypothetical protein BGZ65_006490 [Modicella reniformis]|uniref:Major facilitator superfamily (MFS) profile domain-containing protein n=1 Tax=Modicella reniformis TaxID=1440133 RepID=A0A9P6LXW8_9FUNG|nr:hypothetical protein BGZ65_006490 [Modicella reniformis]
MTTGRISVYESKEQEAAAEDPAPMQISTQRPSSPSHDIDEKVAADIHSDHRSPSLSSTSISVSSTTVEAIQPEIMTAGGSDDDDTGVSPGSIKPVIFQAPPDGGYGWVVVGACFLNNFSMLGIMFSWGIFQQLYTTEVFPGQVSAVSWIGTLAFGCMYIIGGMFSLFAARIGYRKMILTGSIFVAGGCIAASFATQVWHLYLSQGILYGIGAAMANPCILAAPPQWFVARRGMASGIGISGSGIGGLVFSVLTQKLNASIGHRWCLRVLGIIVWCSMVISGMLIRQFSTTGQHVNVSRKDFDIMKQPAFLIMISGVLLTSFGYFSPLNLLPSYAVDHSLSQSQGAMLNSFLNGASFFGRFVGGVFGDRFGLINLTLLCVFASSLTTLVIWMMANSSLAVLLVYVTLYGLMGGGFISLLAPVLAEQFGTSSLTILVGVTFGVNGIGSLLGTPIAAAILANLGGGTGPGALHAYRGAIGFIGGIMAAGSMVFFYMKHKVGGKRTVADTT